MPEQLLSLLGTNLVDFLVYGAIALVVLVGVCKCIYPVFRNGSLLNRAVAKLEKTAGNNQRPPWREPRFLGRALRGEWQKFLLNAGQLDVRGMPCDIEDYINEDSVIDKPGHSQLAELIPSLLTSLGILGTFIGLMEGLTSVNFSDAQGTMDSIPLLLTGMRFAFATSVAGITCSLLFNMFYRMCVGRACRALDSFDEAFYELAMPRPLSPEVQLICQKQDEEERLAHIAEARGQPGFRLAGNGREPRHGSPDQVAGYLHSGCHAGAGGGCAAHRGSVRQPAERAAFRPDDHAGPYHGHGQSGTAANAEKPAKYPERRTGHGGGRPDMQTACAQMAQSLQSWVDDWKSSQARRTEEASALEEQNQHLRQELELLTRSLADMRIAADHLTSELDDQLTRNDLSLPG